MKKVLSLITGLAIAVPAANAQDKLDAPPEASKILIVYYSKTSNTKAFAEHIQKATKGTIVELVPEKPYPEDYKATTEQAKKEINEGFKPTLKSQPDKIANYDVIFVGSPNWWSTMAPPVATFLTSHDFTGKTVIPFMTHAGTGLGKYVEDTRKLVPKATVMGGKAIRGTDAKYPKTQVTDWLKQINAVK